MYMAMLKVFGKKIGGDIVSNKKTYMLITAFNKANAEQRAELEKWINKRNFNTEEKIEAVTRLYNEIGCRQTCKRKNGFLL